MPEFGMMRNSSRRMCASDWNPPGSNKSGPFRLTSKDPILRTQNNGWGNPSTPSGSSRVHRSLHPINLVCEISKRWLYHFIMAIEDAHQGGSQKPNTLLFWRRVSVMDCHSFYPSSSEWFLRWHIAWQKIAAGKFYRNLELKMFREQKRQFFMGEQHTKHVITG